MRAETAISAFLSAKRGFALALIGFDWLCFHHGHLPVRHASASAAASPGNPMLGICLQ
jgi:hypothetical protein